MAEDIFLFLLQRQQLINSVSKVEYISLVVIGSRDCRFICKRSKILKEDWKIASGHSGDLVGEWTRVLYIVILYRGFMIYVNVESEIEISFKSTEHMRKHLGKCHLCH